MLLERITLDAIGRPVLSAGEYQEAELDQVGLFKLRCRPRDNFSLSHLAQAHIEFETTGTLWPEGKEGFQDNKVMRKALLSSEHHSSPFHREPDVFMHVAR